MTFNSLLYPKSGHTFGGDPLRYIGFLLYMRCIILNRVIQFKNLNVIFLTHHETMGGTGQEIKPTYIVMLLLLICRNHKTLQKKLKVLLISG